jgi:flagellar biogenesis protein FliO
MTTPGVMEIVFLIGSLLVLAAIVAVVALVVVRVAGRSTSRDDARLRAIEERLARLERDRDGGLG